METSHLHLGLPSERFPILATCPDHCTFLDMTILPILGDMYQSRSSSYEIP